MVDVRGFNKGMNTDAAPELLPNGAYTYAMNVSNGSEGLVNLPGNQLLPGFPPNSFTGGEWICGSFFDKVRQRIIYFTNHERNVHRIISYSVPDINNPNGSYTVLFEDQNGVFSDWTASPQYDPSLLIKDIKVIHREYEGDLYYFIDPKKRLLKFNYSTILQWKTGNNTLCAFGWTEANYTGTLFSDGTPIPQVTDPVAWAALTTPAWCHYDNDPANDAIYGKLYNWYAVSNPLFAPIGYRVATDTDWDNLVTCLGGASVAGGKLKSTSTLWNAPNTGATNESLFNAIPSGWRDATGLFRDINRNALFWSSTENDANTAFNRKLNLDDAEVDRGTFSKKDGNSVRLIKQ
jgi:uncharacterized protein (TIGR02145 family)